MNKTAIIMFQPFVYEQVILVYENGTLIDTKREPIEKIPYILGELSAQHGLSNIQLIGNQDYLGRMQNEIRGTVPSTVGINILK
jgi:hypothetical protein